MRHFIFLLISFVLFEHSSAQKMMNLERDLKANSEAILVKTKGNAAFGSLFKYEFGPYKVISAKAGWVSSNLKSKFFSKIEKVESKQKANIIMVCNEKDTIEVNIVIDVASEGVRETYLEFGKGEMTIKPDDDLSKFKSTRSLLASIAQIGDSSAWSLALISQVNEGGSKSVNKYRFLTDKISTIEIGEIDKWEDGKSQFGYPIGFEFYLNGKAIAAVQSPLDSFKKNIVWIQNGLDEKMKNVLAAASVVLLNKQFSLQ